MKIALTLLGSSKGATDSLFRLLRSFRTFSGEKFFWTISIGTLLFIIMASMLPYSSDLFLEKIHYLSNIDQALSQVKYDQSKLNGNIANTATAEEKSKSIDYSLFEFNPEDHSYPETYSFKYTSLGFGMKDLEFIQEVPREKSEKKVLNMIPKRFRKKAKIYIKPVMVLCEKYQVDPLWVISVMWTESHFKPMATSHVGAKGLMQIMPSTKRYLLNKIKNEGGILEVDKDSFDVREFFPTIITTPPQVLAKKLLNIELGVIYLKSLLKLFNYNHRHATVAYNMGPGWTLKRLRNNRPVGVRNNYLSKVRTAYKTLASNL